MITSAIWLLCENLGKNEAILILQNIQFLWVLTRKLWLFANLPSQGGNNCWSQLSTAMKFCQKQKVLKIISKSRLEKLKSKMGKIGETFNFFLVRGQKFANFENKSKLFIWQHILFLGVPMRTFQFFEQRSIPKWPKTIKFCQNAPLY